ncbi:MAG: helix-turn-helix domain-containing protein [Gemmatimonadales bacterium]
MTDRQTAGPNPAEVLIAALTEALNRTTAPAATVTHTVTVTATASLTFDRDRLWSCHPETRLAADELAAALGCSPRTIYRLVAEKGMPARKRDEVLVFIAGHVRDWLTDREEIVNRYLPRRAK